MNFVQKAVGLFDTFPEVTMGVLKGNSIPFLEQGYISRNRKIEGQKYGYLYWGGTAVKESKMQLKLYLLLDGEPP
jgi:hypothetical protein